MANIVRTIAADTRVGRLLFSSQLSNPVLVRKRAESGALMAMLIFQHAGSLGRANNDLVKATSHFAVGGVGQTITAWLAGDITLDNRPARRSACRDHRPASRPPSCSARS